ncbi:hypothetical protein DWU99_14130 [Dyella psychrodurans]|uniref:Uncharacterized protein n=2 Tax=Dyella psychrodurans TaxID=1927960 RepID=A0A370X2C4_9GAMM|nr:hypothetical protein DWU99_14130 [Dyella psychrodurans]
MNWPLFDKRDWPLIFTPSHWQGVPLSQLHLITYTTLTFTGAGHAETATDCLHPDDLRSAGHFAKAGERNTCHDI